MSEKTRFSGYSVVFGCALTICLNVGSVGTFGIFLPRIIRSEGYTLAALLLMSTVATITALLVNTFLLSKVIGKIGPKFTLLIGSLLLPIMFVVFGTSQSVYYFYVGGVIGGFAMAFGFQAPVAIMIANWFIEKRASMTSIAITGMTFGSSLMIFVGGQLLARYDWRTVYFILAVVLAVVATLINILFVKESPEKLGQKPLGYGKEQAAAPTAAAATAATDAPYLKTSAFYVLYIAFAIFACGATTVSTLSAAFWQSNGMDATASANFASMASLFGFVGTLVCGPITDKMGIKFTIGYTAVAAVAYIALMGASAASLSVVIIILALCCRAFSVVINSTVPSLTTMEAFGPKNFRKVLGIFTGAVQLGQAVMAAVAGHIVDLTGTYTYTFILCGAVVVIGAVLVFVGIGMSPYQKEKKLKAANA